MNLYVCYVEESRPFLWSSGQSSWLQNGDILCFLWGTNWIYICYAEKSTPHLWSIGQSSWLQIQRCGFDSRRYQIFWEVVGLERGPLRLVSTIEELFERKSSGSGTENWDYGCNGSAVLATWQSLSARVGTNFADKRRSLGQYSLLGRYSLLTDSSHGVKKLYLDLPSGIFLQVFWPKLCKRLSLSGCGDRTEYLQPLNQIKVAQ
jgi:hypothetical protein